jgi:hypothetical protein
LLKTVLRVDGQNDAISVKEQSAMFIQQQDLGFTKLKNMDCGNSGFASVETALSALTSRQGFFDCVSGKS